MCSQTRPSKHDKLILALFAEEAESLGGCHIYRITSPLWQLGQKPGWKATWAPMSQHKRPDVWQALAQSNLVILPRLWVKPNETGFQYQTNSLLVALVEQKLVDPNGVYPFVELSRALGKRVVYEVDDDYTNLHRNVHGGGQSAMDIAATCDAITVSTPYLADVMKAQTGNQNVYVLPNCIDGSLWSRETERKWPKDELIIGLTGSITHYDDWKVLADVIPDLLAIHPNVKFVLGNFAPDYFDGLPEDQYEFVPGLSYGQYSQLVRNFDIVLAPLDPADPFNWSKSGIKAIEGMGAGRKDTGRWEGACVLATKTSVYDRVVRHGKTGLLVEHDPDHWYHALDIVIKDVDLRHQLAYRGYKWVADHRDIRRQWNQWAKAYTKILAE